MRDNNINDKDINVSRLYSIKGLTQPFQSGAQQDAERAGFTPHFLVNPLFRIKGAGFTLVETMIALVVFVVLFGAMFIIMIKSIDSFYIGDGHVYLGEEGSRAIEEMSRLLGESNVDVISFPVESDPLTGGSFPMLMLPSARGDPEADPPADSFHVSVGTSTFAEPDWQSVVIYYPYQTDGITQLRQYAIYDSDFSKRFPFSLSDITAGQISISNSAGEIRSVQRNSGRVIANYFNINGSYQIQHSANLVIIDLPLKKQIRQVSRGAELFLDSNVRSAVTLKSRALETE